MQWFIWTCLFPNHFFHVVAWEDPEALYMREFRFQVWIVCFYIADNIFQDSYTEFCTCCLDYSTSSWDLQPWQNLISQSEKTLIWLWDSCHSEIMSFWNNFLIPLPGVFLLTSGLFIIIIFIFFTLFFKLYIIVLHSHNSQLSREG